jgi:maleate cis-trans isomerase
MDTIIDTVVNPLIEEIRPFFKSSGLELPSFTSITSSNIEIREMTYQIVYSVTKTIDLNNYMGCLSSIFTIESTNLVENINMKEGASMRFKRVSNFTLLDSQVAFIVEKISQ